MSSLSAVDLRSGCIFCTSNEQENRRQILKALQLALPLSDGLPYPKNLDRRARAYLEVNPGDVETHFLLGVLEFATWQDCPRNLFEAKRHLEAAFEGDHKNMYALALLIEVIQSEQSDSYFAQKQRVETLLSQADTLYPLDLVILRAQAMRTAKPLMAANTVGDAICLEIPDVTYEAYSYLNGHCKNDEVRAMQGLIVLQGASYSEALLSKDLGVQLIEKKTRFCAVSMAAHAAKWLFINRQDDQCEEVCYWLTEALRGAASSIRCEITIVKSVLDQMPNFIREKLLQHLLNRFDDMMLD